MYTKQSFLKDFLSPEPALDTLIVDKGLGNLDLLDEDMAGDGQKIEDLKKAQRQLDTLLDENKKILSLLEKERDFARLNVTCLDAIGEKPKEGEDQYQYFMRAAASYPPLIDDINFALDSVIMQIPEEGLDVSGQKQTLFEQQIMQSGGVDAIRKVRPYIQDGVFTREDAIRFYSEIPVGSSDMHEPTSEEMQKVKQAYSDRTGIQITDEKLLKGITVVESMMRDQLRLEVAEYKAQHPEIVEEACKLLEATPTSKGIKP